jgi:hypothetical protein
MLVFPEEFVTNKPVMPPQARSTFGQDLKFVRYRFRSIAVVERYNKLSCGAASATRTALSSRFVQSCASSL